MGERRSAALDRTFSALGDPTRRAILARLRRGPRTVSELALPFPVSLNTVSKHIRVLERAGLIRRRVDGRHHHCSLAPDPLARAADWIGDYGAFWEKQLDGLEAHLAGEKLAREKRGARPRRRSKPEENRP